MRLFPPCCAITPMIRLAEAADAAPLTVFCGDSLLGAYIQSRFAVYGNRYPFARCYIDRRQSEVVTALSVLEGQAVLLTGERTDSEELAALLPVLALQSVMTDAETAQTLRLPVKQEKQSFRFAGQTAAFAAQDDAPLRAVYDLISASIPGSFPASKEAYLHFLSDFTFRRQRGFARLKAITEKDFLCACALTAAECPTAAVISGVASADVCRGKGFGKAVVSALAGALQQENKTVYVIALNDSAAAFYRRVGFRDGQRIVWI